MAGEAAGVNARRKLRRIEVQIKQEALRLLRLGYSGRELERRLARFVRSLNIAAELAGRYDSEVKAVQNRAVADAERQYAWVRERTVEPEKLAASAELVKQAHAGFATVAGQVERGVASAVTKAVAGGATRKQVEELLSAQFRKEARHAYTIANTGIAAIDRTAALALGFEAGVFHKRYSGAAPERPKCKAWHGRVFTLTQINNLDNGQGLSAMIYCGGYNCVHWWEDVLTGKEPATKRQLDAALNALHRAVIK